MLWLERRIFIGSYECHDWTGPFLLGLMHVIIEMAHFWLIFMNVMVGTSYFYMALWMSWWEWRIFTGFCGRRAWNDTFLFGFMNAMKGLTPCFMVFIWFSFGVHMVLICFSCGSCMVLYDFHLGSTWYISTYSSVWLDILLHNYILLRRISINLQKCF